MLRVVVVFGAAVLVAGAVAADARIAAARAQGTPPGRKSDRTPAQRKLNSGLLAAIDRLKRPDSTTAPPARGLVRIDDRHRACVDVRAPVTDRLAKQINALGGTIVSSSRRDDSTVAWIPLLSLERLAADDAVRSIMPASEPTLHQ
jgi:hypothetical protein